MTVYIEKPAVNLREELASLRNQGGYQEQQFYFENAVTNGTFDADTNWTKGTGWTIGSGVASCDGAQVSATDLTSGAVTLVAGRTYILSAEITGYSVGTVNSISVSSTGASEIVSKSANGVYTATFVAPSASEVITVSANSVFVGSVDNISVFETDGTDVIHTMPKGWVPKDVFEDGLLQREGAANDYEVIYDGFDYVVKPTVAPSATTQTCVIGVRK